MLKIARTAAIAGSLLFGFHGATGPPAHGRERHILFSNETRELIVEIYVSDTGAGDWQGDLLGSDFLLPGNSMLVDIDDRNGRCRVDVKTVLDDGKNFVSRGVNICRAEGDAVSVR